MITIIDKHLRQQLINDITNVLPRMIQIEVNGKDKWIELSDPMLFKIAWDIIEKLEDKCYSITKKNDNKRS